MEHRVDASDKDEVLEALAGLIAGAGPGHEQAAVLRSLAAREQLGSTGLGRGVAIPHGRHAVGREPRAAFLSTAEAIDFDAIDGKPVDLFFALMVPAESNEEHLNLLAELAEMLSDEALVQALRACQNSEAVYDLLTARRC